MGKNKPQYSGWVYDLRSMLAVVDEPGHIVRARCLKCLKHEDLDRDALRRIAKAKGLAYSLINKRTRCRLTTGCTGWNVFSWQGGPWFYGLFDQAQMDRWDEADRESERRGRKFMVDYLKGHTAEVEADKARKRH